MNKKLSFNDVPELYERLRPTYPEKLIEDIINYSALTSTSEILEIGPGTGQITLPFARRGYSITGIEIGENLVDHLRTKLLNYPNAKIYNYSFEEWDNMGKTFDLIISAQAFHWIDPNIGYPKVEQLLNKNGRLALIWIYHPCTDMINELDKVYKKYFPNYKKLEDVESQMNKQIEEIKASNLFANLKVYTYQFEIEYTSSQYIDLLDTYSDHRTMDKEIKSLLFNEIKKTINKFGGKIRKPYIATLYFAEKNLLSSKANECS